MKLSGKSDFTKYGPSICWTGNNTLAILTGELAIRMWDLHTGDTFLLSPPENSSGNVATPLEVCTSLSYCKMNGMFAKIFSNEQKFNVYNVTFFVSH